MNFRKYSSEGYSSTAFLAILFVLMLAAFSLYLLHLQKKDSPAVPDTGGNKLQNEVTRLYNALDMAESMKNRHKYLDIVGKIERLLIRNDVYWDKKMSGQKGVMDGMMSGLNEYYQSHFTTDDKLAILSEKYGLPPAKLRRLKEDLEIMFSEELASKFAPAPDTKEEKRQAV